MPPGAPPTQMPMELAAWLHKMARGGFAKQEGATVPAVQPGRGSDGIGERVWLALKWTGDAELGRGPYSVWAAVHPSPTSGMLHKTAQGVSRSPALQAAQEAGDGMRLRTSDQECRRAQREGSGVFRPSVCQVDSRKKGYQ
ncbi:hypothetical protein MG293_018086 [Ovis ammon polii]|uniref:Uncharacterized protein n=1 Tax=Ovis ammon polii TaxID=230172 RepID=A0AAD4TNS8_OVIAM|nr:hypothetical protein MG293_018086 [Ovis ammon polii]